MKTPEELMKIAVVDGRFPAGSPEELAIASDGYHSYRYAVEVIKGRFELGEAAIATDALDSYYYAAEVIKGRFPLGEPAIATDANYSYLYAAEVIEGRFKIAEHVILSSLIYASIYVDVHKGKITTVELMLLKLRYPNIK